MTIRSLLPLLLTVLVLLSSGSARGSDADLGPTEFDPKRVTQVSWQPRAFLYKKFLSDEECDHLIGLAKDHMEKSMVADNESGRSVESTVRTSSGHFLRRNQDEVVSRIERRIAAWTFLPEENGENIHVLRYEKGQKYDAHYDYFHDKYNQALGGHRYATVLMYLADVKLGGETVFPNAVGKHLQAKDETWSDCSREGFAVKARKGDTVLFFSLYPNATTDEHSLHGSCPVIEGEKWSATKWIHVRPFRVTLEPERPSGESGDCMDESEYCEYWAGNGECTKNVIYMVGSPDSPGHCRKSCNACPKAKEESSSATSTELLEVLDEKPATMQDETVATSNDASTTEPLLVSNVSASTTPDEILETTKDTDSKPSEDTIPVDTA